MTNTEIVINCLTNDKCESCPYNEDYDKCYDIIGIVQVIKHPDWYTITRRHKNDSYIRNSSDVNMKTKEVGFGEPIIDRSTFGGARHK